MKNLLIIALFAFLLNGCRYVNTQEAYPDAKASDQLDMPEGLDKPNSSSALEVPEVNSDIANKNSVSPPDMPIRTQQSESGIIRIESIEGFAVLTIKAEKADVWEKLSQFELENWLVTETNEDTCTVSLKYNDQDARKREKTGFFKKIFSRKQYYSDYSGEYKFTCKQSSSINQIKFSSLDGSVAKSVVVDIAMNHLYSHMQ
jgi:uncharacterized lipoprotein